MELQIKFWVFNSMQIIYQNKNERCGSRRTDTVDAIICVGRIGRYLEGECNGRFGKWKFKLYNSRRISGRFERRV